jgi:hypothetical protein
MGLFNSFRPPLGWMDEASKYGVAP